MLNIKVGWGCALALIGACVVAEEGALEDMSIASEGSELALALCPDGYEASGTKKGMCKYTMKGNVSSKNKFISARCDTNINFPDNVLCKISGECVYHAGTGFPKCRAPQVNANGTSCTDRPNKAFTTEWSYNMGTKCSNQSQNTLNNTCTQQLDSLVFDACANYGSEFETVTAQCCSPIGDTPCDDPEPVDECAEIPEEPPSEPPDEPTPDPTPEPTPNPSEYELSD